MKMRVRNTNEELLRQEVEGKGKSIKKCQEILLIPKFGGVTQCFAAIKKRCGKTNIVYMLRLHNSYT